MRDNRIKQAYLIGAADAGTIRLPDPMTELLTKAFAELNKLSSERQDELARMLLELVATDGRIDSFILTPEQEAGLREAIERADRGEFASDEEVEAVYRKFGA